MNADTPKAVLEKLINDNPNVDLRAIEDVWWEIVSKDERLEDQVFQFVEEQLRERGARTLQEMIVLLQQLSRGH